jgi:hypothetical protein
MFSARADPTAEKQVRHRLDVSLKPPPYLAFCGSRQNYNLKHRFYCPFQWVFGAYPTGETFQAFIHQAAGHATFGYPTRVFVILVVTATHGFGKRDRFGTHCP